MSGKKGMYIGHKQDALDPQRGFGVATPQQVNTWLGNAPPAEYWRRTK